MEPGTSDYRGPKYSKSQYMGRGRGRRVIVKKKGRSLKWGGERRMRKCGWTQEEEERGGRPWEDLLGRGREGGREGGCGILTATISLIISKTVKVLALYKSGHAYSAYPSFLLPLKLNSALI